MYNKPMISLEQAQNAITAMIADYNRDTDRRKVDMAVVDDAGNLLAYARMDRCLRPTLAIRKAYTSAVRSMDTAAFAEQLSSTGRSLESFGDPQLVAIPGGVAVFHDGAVVGAIGGAACPAGSTTRPSPRQELQRWASSGGGVHDSTLPSQGRRSTGGSASGASQRTLLAFIAATIRPSDCCTAPAVGFSGGGLCRSARDIATVIVVLLGDSVLGVRVKLGRRVYGYHGYRDAKGAVVAFVEARAVSS